MQNRFRRLVELPYYAGEYYALRLIPSTGPGMISRLLFKVPLLVYRIGLSRLISNQILLLTTTGRCSGKPRVTALGYHCDPATKTYYVSAGWRGQTNWYRNVKVNAKVSVQVGNYRFNAIAEPVNEAEALQLLSDYAKRNPFAERLYSRMIGMAFDGSQESQRKVAAYFPAIALRARK